MATIVLWNKDIHYSRSLNIRRAAGIHYVSFRYIDEEGDYQSDEIASSRERLNLSSGKIILLHKRPQ